MFHAPARAAVLLAVVAALIPRPALSQAQPGAVAAPAYAEAIERGRAMARATLASDSLPGLSIAVGVNGQIVWAEGFGWADVARREPVAPSTLFRIASSAKPMTSAAAALLAERGRLDLDAPVRGYVPEFPQKPWPVTTRQLLGHLGGIRDYRSEADALGTRRCADVREGLQAFAADSLIAPPGTRFQYTSFGYTLAGAAIQAAAGMPYAEFMRREVFQPLGMTSTVPERAGEPVPGRATFYVRSAGLAVAPHDDDSCVLPGGGFLSTPSDLVRFGIGMMDGRLLRPESVARLWTAQRLATGASTGYGLGWMVREVRWEQGAPAGRLFGHGGSSVGAATSFMVLPDERVVVSVTTNVAGAQVLPLAGRIAREFRPRP